MRRHPGVHVAVLIALLALPLAPAVAVPPGAPLQADVRSDPLPARALAGDPLDAVLRTVGAPDAALAPGAWIPADGVPDLVGALAAVYVSAGETAPAADERARLAAAADAMPPAWRAATALILAAVADALATRDAAPNDPARLAAAARVVRTVQGVLPAIEEHPHESPFLFEDSRGYLRVDTRRHDTAHERLFIVNIDAHGNDTYVGNHAGAVLGKRAVMMVLDLEGHDAYLTTPTRGQLSAHGASTAGVLGLLVDRAGDDTYTATHVRPDRPSAYQGGCWGTGLGLLVDHAGNDTFDARGTDQGGVQGGGTGCPGILLDLEGDDAYRAGNETAVAAQGAAGFAGTGVLVDRAGDDAYAAETRMRHGRAALPGWGLLVDLAGSDTYDGEPGDNRITPYAVVGTGSGVGVRVDHDTPRPSESVVTYVYFNGARDEDGDGHSHYEFRRRDVYVHPNGTIETKDDAPYRPLGRNIAGDPDDRERLEAVTVTGGARCVIAIVDTGVNPYHLEFRAPGYDAATAIPGFPGDAVRVELALDAPGYGHAVTADAAFWSSVEAGVLYSFPGTRIAGGISFGGHSDPYVGARRILDDSGHGTAVTGAAVGLTTGLAPECVVVAVEAGDLTAAMEWIAEQDWIDAVSFSIGSRVYTPDPIANATRTVTRTGKPVFVAGGNGLTHTDLPTPSTNLATAFAGPGWVVSVGAVAWWNNQSVWWGSYPVDVVSRGVDVRLPASSSVDGTQRFDGSSAAAPRVAGAAAEALRALRAHVAAHGTPESGPLADGVLTRGEWEFAILRSARAVDVATSFMECATPSVDRCILNNRWPAYMLPAAPGAEFVTQGYGVVDAATRDLAARVLTGEDQEPDRGNADAWWRAVHAVRETFWAGHDDNGLYVNL